MAQRPDGTSRTASTPARTLAQNCSRSAAPGKTPPSPTMAMRGSVVMDRSHPRRLRGGKAVAAVLFVQPLVDGHLGPFHPGDELAIGAQEFNIRPGHAAGVLG